MRRGMTRRDVMGTGIMAAGCLYGCRIVGDAAALRSTCCERRDLGLESVICGAGGLTTDLGKARLLREVRNAAYRADPSRSRQLIVVHRSRIDLRRWVGSKEWTSV
jgi:hypothetical protein